MKTNTPTGKKSAQKEPPQGTRASVSNPRMDFPQARKLLGDFRFQDLFIEVLGWSRPQSSAPAELNCKGVQITRRHIADLSGVGVYEVRCNTIPAADARAAIHKEIAAIQHECLVIFTDTGRTRSVWRWAKREGGKAFPREHTFMRGQPGDLFIGKLGAMVFDFSDFESPGGVALTDVCNRLRAALDVQPVTKRFYTEFQQAHDDLVTLIAGIENQHDRRWYASILLNRLMFIYFLQRKGFLDFKRADACDGNLNYLQDKLAESKRAGRDRFYANFLQMLFFEGFAKPEDKRSPAARAALGAIRYLNGGLFLPHPIEARNSITVPDAFFDRLFDLFSKYSWNLNDTPGGDDREISPHILGYIFEKYINQKAFGAYYTRPEITEYLCEQTIHRLVLDAVNTPQDLPTLPGVKRRAYDSIGDLLVDLDAPVCQKLLNDVLPRLSLLDPACGSGAFLVSAMNTLINLYSAVIGRLEFLNNPELSAWLENIRRQHANIAYYIKKSIITHNLFGVDIMEEATEIARLRLFLALVASAETVKQLEPLPNIDFNILPGNSLVGLLRVDGESFEKRECQGNLFRQKSYREILQEKNRLIEIYRGATIYANDLAELRDEIDEKKKACTEVLDDLLLDQFESLGIKYEEATWGESKGAAGKPKKRALALKDIRQLKPFHWGFEFDEVLGKRGGFDAIITNPPWEIFKPNGKEFFENYSDLITRKKMQIHDFLDEQARLLGKDEETRRAWLEYLSGFPHVSAYFRSAPHYANQISVVNDKKAGTDINLYKLFTEQCVNLLRPGGRCGIVIPSGIYTDLGAKQLRQMLFERTRIDGLFCFENRRQIFEGVHRSFKFVVLTFQKGGPTTEFPAAFMRHEVADLERFPQHGAVQMSVDLVRRFSPDSLSIMEFKSDLDIQIARKMLRFPLLGESVPGAWEVRFGREFDMTNDSDLFKTAPGKGRLPLYEGKMIWQFEHQLAAPRYWVDEKEGRARILGREKDTGQTLDYQDYRLGFRKIASNTNERTLVSTVIAPTFCGENFQCAHRRDLSGSVALPLSLLPLICALLNSFALDYVIRQRVSANVNFFYVYQLPVPRLTEKDAAFAPIVQRAARLICTTPEFDTLAKAVGLKSHKDGVTDPAQRAAIRAELDALIAHLYGLTEAEFAHILSTFPLVPQETKSAALAAYRKI